LAEPKKIKFLKYVRDKGKPNNSINLLQHATAGDDKAEMTNC